MQSLSSELYFILYREYLDRRVSYIVCQKVNILHKGYLSSLRIQDKNFPKKVLLFGGPFYKLMNMHTHKPIIHSSIDQMTSDPKIVRLTFLTTFFHSMIVTLLIILNTNKLFVQYAQKGSDLGKIPQFLIQQINSHHVVLVFIIVTIILFLLYSVVYPIGLAAVIHYLHHKKGIRDSIRASWACFYPMFEF